MFEYSFASDPTFYVNLFWQVVWGHGDWNSRRKVLIQIFLSFCKPSTYVGLIKITKLNSLSPIEATSQLTLNFNPDLVSELFVWHKYILSKKSSNIILLLLLFMVYFPLNLQPEGWIVHGQVLSTNKLCHRSKADCEDNGSKMVVPITQLPTICTFFNE